MKSTRKLINAAALSALITAPLAGCASKAEVVRPKGQSLNSALGEKAVCTPETLKDPNGTERYVVEWSDGDRATLESEMARGVALVKFSCEGIKVLRSCAVPGEYAYKASSKKTNAIQIEDSASASANLSSPTPGANFQAALAQGRMLNLAYVMVGSLSTTVSDVTREQITRDACREATHFVYETKVGAFAVAASERGQAMAAAEVLRYGNASAEAASARQAVSSDGDAEACAAATSRDAEPPEGCKAMMRISIVPLVEGKIAATTVAKEGESGSVASRVDTRTCTNGLVFDGDACVKPAAAQSYLCERDDLKGCEQQCVKGSAQSCGRMADALFKKHQFYGYYVSQEYSAKQFDALKAAASIQPKMQSACEDELDASACALSAMLVGVKSGKTSGPDDAAQAKLMLSLMETGCEWGSGFACGFIVDAYGEANFEEQGIMADGEKLEEIVAEGCDSGSVQACMKLGEFFYQGTMLALGDSQVEPDYSKSAKYTAKACYGGVSEACFWSAIMYGANDAATCEALINQHIDPSAEDIQGYISLAWPTFGHQYTEKSVRELCQRTARVHNKQKAIDLAGKACHLSGGDLSRQACALSSTLAR